MARELLGTLRAVAVGDGGLIERVVKLLWRPERPPGWRRFSLCRYNPRP